MITSENIFLDYGELIFHYDFNRKTLQRAHNLALQHINSNSDREVSLNRLAKAHKEVIRGYLQTRRRTGTEWTMEKITGAIADILDINEDVSSESLARIYKLNDHNAYPMATTLESIPELRKIGRLGIISNLPHDSLVYELDNHGLADVFDHIVISYEVGYRKPHPAIYQEALRRAQITPKQAVFFSHDQEEVDGALAVGMQSHLVKNLGEAVTKLRHN